MLTGAAVKEISREEGVGSLIPSSTHVADCMRDEVDSRYWFHHHHVWMRLKLCGCRHTSVPVTSTSSMAWVRLKTVELEHAGAVCLFFVAEGVVVVFGFKLLLDFLV
jgi:hypothetical protein